MGDDQIVVFPLHHGAEHTGSPEVGRGGDALGKGQLPHRVGVGDVPHRAAAGHLHLPAQLAEAAEVGQVEADDVGEGGRGV